MFVPDGIKSVCQCKTKWETLEIVSILRKSPGHKGQVLGANTHYG